MQQSSERVAHRQQHNNELATSSPQNLFIDMSTELLRRGQSVRFRAPGLSMHPAIKEGETITVAPVTPLDIKRGDILLYLAGRKVVAHRVVSIKRKKTDSKPQSSANFAIHASTPSLAHSSTHSSTQASTYSKELNPRHLFILRGDASLTSDDPVEEQQILGKVVSVERGGRSIDLYNRKVKIIRTLRLCASHIKRWARNFFYMRLPRRCAPRNDSNIVMRATERSEAISHKE